MCLLCLVCVGVAVSLNGFQPQLTSPSLKHPPLAILFPVPVSVPIPFFPVLLHILRGPPFHVFWVRDARQEEPPAFVSMFFLFRSHRVLLRVLSSFAAFHLSANLSFCLFSFLPSILFFCFPAWFPARFSFNVPPFIYCLAPGVSLLRAWFSIRLIRLCRCNFLTGSGMPLPLYYVLNTCCLESTGRLRGCSSLYCWGQPPLSIASYSSEVFNLEILS